MKEKEENISLEEAIKKASFLLSKRMHSISELKTKLSKKYPPHIVNACLSELTRLNFLNDERYAQCYAEELKAKGLTKLAIQTKLLKRGLSPDIVEKFTPPITQEEEKALAEKILRTKLKTLQKIQPAKKRKEKIFRLLKSRGFSNETIFSILSSFEPDDQINY